MHAHSEVKPEALTTGPQRLRSSCDELAELFPAARVRVAAELAQALLHLLVGECLAECRMQLVDDGLGRSGRHEQAGPFEVVEMRLAQLLERGHVGQQRGALRAVDRQHLELAALLVGHEVGDGHDAGRDLVAQQVLHQRRGAAVRRGHQVGLGLGAEAVAHELRDAARRGHAVAGLLRIGARDVQPLLHVLGRQRGRHGDAFVEAGDAAHGLEVLHRVVAHRLRGQRQHHHHVHVGQQHGEAVGRARCARSRPRSGRRRRCGCRRPRWCRARPRACRRACAPARRPSRRRGSRRSA